ncbi:LOW QUALITY PROTEIN: NADP-dependent oxidoreductase domain-containing protein 1 [Pluvialis apricaria]
MWDITETFKSYQAGEAVPGEEAVMYLTRCRKGLAVNACAHATFFCKLLHDLRQSRSEKGLPTSLGDSHSLKVGIIGGGHLGSRAPDAELGSEPQYPSDWQKQGLTCFYNNAQLVAADVAFLCCLPSHMLSICSVVRPAIQKPCVCSLVTAVPLLRLKQLLCDSAIVRRQYQGKEPIDDPGMKGTVPAALRDPAAVQAPCACSSPGKIRVNAKWLVAIFYTALNSGTWQSLHHHKVLKLLNDLCFPECCPICAEQKTSCPWFVCKSFVSRGFGSSVTQEETFPWFDVTAAQPRESPFTQLLEKTELVRCHLALPYQASFGDWPTKQCGLINTKTSLTSAVVKPGVTLDDKSPFFTALPTCSQKSQRKLLTMILNLHKL